MTVQDIPGYKTAFKEAPWKTSESPHYHFHYMEGSLAAEEIELITKTQEDAYLKIISFLGLSSYPERKISYYLYPNSETKERLMGNSWFAQAIYDDLVVHALYTKEHRVIGPHEDTHLLSLPLGLSIGFLQEGLVEYMVGHSWHGESFEKIVREAHKDKNFVISTDLLTVHDTWRNTDDTYTQQYYALAALFTQHLIAEYGKEKYFELYRALAREAPQSENAEQYQKILTTTSEDLFAAFLASIEG